MPGLVVFAPNLISPGAAMEAAQLITYLEGVAASFEAETGSPDPEIRAKIAQLKAVLAQRDATLSSEASRMHAQEDATKEDEDVGADAALRQASQRMAAVESVLSQVEGELATDSDAKLFLAQSAELWMPVIGAGLDNGGEPGGPLAEGEGEGAEEMQE